MWFHEKQAQYLPSTTLSVSCWKHNGTNNNFDKPLKRAEWFCLKTKTNIFVPCLPPPKAPPKNQRMRSGKKLSVIQGDCYNSSQGALWISILRRGQGVEEVTHRMIWQTTQESNHPHPQDFPPHWDKDYVSSYVGKVRVPLGKQARLQKGEPADPRPLVLDRDRASSQAWIFTIHSQWSYCP